jgi:ABC-type sugar transport system ATPase subunit
MLAIARTLMGNPKLVLLDEPSEGIAPVIVEQLALRHSGAQSTRGWPCSCQNRTSILPARCPTAR